MLETNLNYPRIQSEVENSRRIIWRNSRDYRNAFGYDWQNLREKTILDVGAGMSNFAKVAANVYGARVVNLDPNDFQESVDSVRGIAQKLPFKTEAFDEVIASHSLYWIFTGLDQALLEMVRVTKPNGKIKIHPVTLDIKESAIQLPDFVSIRPVAKGNTLVIHKTPSIDDWESTINEVLSQVNIDSFAIRAASRDRKTMFIYSRI